MNRRRTDSSTLPDPKAWQSMDETLAAVVRDKHALLDALKAARLALEDTAAQASLAVRQTALVGWPMQAQWLVGIVQREAVGGIAAIDAAIEKAEGKQ